MSSWGTGIKQNDTFYDVYEEFFDRYRDDVRAEDVCRAMLDEYLKEYSWALDENERNEPAIASALYPMYYALALALWECGCRDEALWQKIKEIIDSRADLLLWDEMDDSLKLRKSRQKALLKFWDKINSTPEKIKKPKKTQKKREPTLHKGDLYAYAYENGYRVALVLDFVWNSYLTAISEDIFDHVPDEAEAMGAYTHTVVWFSARASIPKKDRIPVASLELSGDYNNRAGLLYSTSIIGCSSIGERAYFFDPAQAEPCMQKNRIGRYRLRELLDPKVLPKYQPNMNEAMLIRPAE